MHFVYHPHHEPVVVPPEEYEHYLKNGWYDTPAKFPAVESKGLVKADERSEPEPEQVAAPKKKKGRPPKVKAEEAQAVDA